MGFKVTGGASCEVRGLEQLAKQLDVTVSRVEQAAAATVYAQTLALVDLINRNYMVPVKSGRLRASTYVTLPDWSMGNPTSELGYAVPYADEVHERGAGGKGYKVGEKNARKGRPQWLLRARYLWSMSYYARFQASFQKYIVAGIRPEYLTGLVPVLPIDPGAQGGGGVSRHQKRYGFTHAQKKRLFKMRRAGSIAFVGFGHRKKKKSPGRPRKKKK